MLIYQFCSEAKKCNPQMKFKKFTELTMDIQLKKPDKPSRKESVMKYFSGRKSFFLIK